MFTALHQHRFFHGRSYTVIVVGILALTGCSDGLSSLSGTVKLDGQPAPAGISLRFSPQAKGASPSYATTEADGHYEAKFTFQKSGIAPGKHVVQLMPSRNDAAMPKLGADGKPEPVAAAAAPKLPNKYYEEITAITVDEGSNVLDIELESAKENR
jgi:hypothetical protein